MRLLSSCQPAIAKTIELLTSASALCADEDNEDNDLNLERYRDIYGKEESMEEGHHNEDTLNTLECGNSDNRDGDKVECLDNVVKYASNVEKNWYRYPNPEDALNNEYLINELDESFSLPPQLPSFRKNMIAPRNQRIFDLIMHTAKKTRTQHQLEILIKVKQGDNAKFDFLRDDHSLNPFYQFIKSLPDQTFWSALLQREVETPSVKNIPIDTKRVTTNALSILGDAYVSGSDEEGRDEDIFMNVSEDKNRGVNEDGLCEMRSQPIDEGNKYHGTGEAIRLRRLERAKKMRRHFFEKTQSSVQINNEDIHQRETINEDQANHWEDKKFDEGGGNFSQDERKRKTSCLHKIDSEIKIFIEGNVIRHGISENMISFVRSYTTKCHA